MNTKMKQEARCEYQLRWLCSRGAVNAVPDSCSAYSPMGHRCGLFILE